VIGAVTSRLRGLTPQRVLRHRPVREFLWMTAGILLTAWGLASFLIPNKIAAGGVSGLSTIVYYLLKEVGLPTFPVGTWMLVFNGILLLVAWRFSGMRYAAKTIYGTVGLSVAVDLIGHYAPPLASDNLLLAALWGGATTGIGIGMVFKVGGNTGGTDIVAQLLSRRVPLAVGQLMLAIDAVITITAGFAFGLNYALYAAVAIVVGGATIDLVLEGPVVEKAAWIISDRAEQIGSAINEEMKRGATAISATGGYTGEPRGMLYVVVSRQELDALKQLVSAIDPSAFMVVSDVHEAIGEGFRQFDAAQ
jgi:uncharacterized membrane-anchored protein YitT (DUF2179 family)